MRTKSFLSILLTMLVVANAFGQSAVMPSGSGTSGDPYQVASLDNLYWISQNPTSWGSHFRQTMDIDASGTSSWDDGDGGDADGFLPIGNDTDMFTGSYSGGGYTISNLFIYRNAGVYVGLFGFTNGATIDSLVLNDVDITGSTRVGALVGIAENYTNLDYCYSSGSVTGDSWYIGGLVGWSDYSYVDFCGSSASVTGTNATGGLVGYSKTGFIHESYATGSVIGAQWTGGLLGYANSSSQVNNSYATGTVLGSGDYVGGLIGQNGYSSVSNSYSSGSVSGTASYVGGLIGYQNSASAGGSFWDTETSGQTTSAAGTGKSTAEMTTFSTFSDAGWTITDESNTGYKWNIESGINSGYPFLGWAPGFDASLGPVPTQQTVTIYGANGDPGTQDPYIQALAEGATEWTQAYLTGYHPWGYVPGTNSWLNFDPSDTVGVNTSTPYRIRFMVPEDYTDPSMVFHVKADNLGIIYINDTYIDSVQGEATPNVPDATIEQALNIGMNEIRITMVDWGGIVGLNYRIDVTMTSAEDISDAVLTPEDAAALNNAPVADAGDDQYLGTNEVMLDGSGSSDPDGNVLVYNWTVAGDTIASGVNPTVTLPNGSHTVTLHVTDGELTDMDDVMINVDAEGPALDLSARIVPRNGTEVVGPGRGHVLYDIRVNNYARRPARFTLRIFAENMDTGRRYGPLAGTPVRTALGPRDSGIERLRQHVPAWVPPGEYAFVLEVGNGHDGVVAYDHFIMTRLGEADPAAPGTDENAWAAYYDGTDIPVLENDLWTIDGKYREDGSDILSTTSIADETEIVPSSYSLSQNYPNPFNPSTTISFSLETAGEVSLKVYDINGVEVAQLASGQYAAGQHTVNFGPENMSSGTYLYVLESGSFREVKRMAYLK